MIRTVYIAAPFPLRDEAKDLRKQLADANVACTANWIDGDPATEKESAAAATLDFADILRAEAVVFLNPEYWATRGTGGRHTEIGFALAHSIPIFMIGKASNAFHCLPEVVVLSTMPELLEALQLVEPQPRRPVDHPANYGGADNPYEAIKVIEAWELNFSLGNAVKYIARAGKKDGVSDVEDLQKAAWYLNRELERREPIKRSDAPVSAAASGTDTAGSEVAPAA